MPANHSEIHLFTIRIWFEENETAPFECRGRIQHGLHGPVRHFQGWAALVDHMHEMVQPADAASAQDTPFHHAPPPDDDANQPP